MSSLKSLINCNGRLTRPRLLRGSGTGPAKIARDRRDGRWSHRIAPPPDRTAKMAFFVALGFVRFVGESKLALSLPEAISGRNSYWLRGYGNPPPEMLIIIGYSRASAERYFTSCELVGHITNRYSVENQETQFHPDILVCREPRQPWPALWERMGSFS